MCVILDTNLYSDFLSGHKDMLPVKHWIEKKQGKLAYVPVGKIERELKRHGKMSLRIKSMSQAGQVKQYGQDDVNEMKQTLTGLKSNDPDIIALAKASGATLLISRDQALHEDFKANISDGKIYQKAKHRHLLRRYSCP